MNLKINAELVIVGDGEAFKDGSVVIEDKTIKYAGESEHAPSASTELSTPVVMPGLWDSHAHFSGIMHAALEKTIFVTPQVAALRCTWDAREALFSGITSVRDVGGLGIYLNKVVQEGLIQGPRIYGAGKVISTTGGHGDIHGIPLSVLNALHHANRPVLGHLADGRDECYKAVRTQLRGGAEVIKFCASGGVMSEIDHPIHQQFSLDEQKAIVEEAERAETVVAAHCHGSPGIRAALEAGVKTIEHGSYLTEELANLMIEKEAILVPTRYVVSKLVENGDKMGVPEYAMTKIKSLHERHLESIKIAIDKGVKIAMGTDIFTSGPNSIFRWGDNAQELEYLVEAGLPPMKAIQAGTGMGPKTVGKRANQSGLLKGGYDADLLLVKTDPLKDISILANRQNFSHIIKSGKIVQTY